MATLTLSLKPSSSVFRFKSAGRNLTSDDEYGKNLFSDLDNLHSQISITVTDLQKVLTAWNQENLPEKQKNQRVSGQVIMLLYFGSIKQVNMSSI